MLWLKVGILDYHISNHAWSQNLDIIAIIGKDNYIVANVSGIMARYGHT